jgi:phosphoribosyl 1,2-cyclic phosphate phosphodiesterase
VEEALVVAAQIGAKQTFFTHIAHALAHEATKATLPPNIRLAHDGLKITI